MKLCWVGEMYLTTAKRLRLFSKSKNTRSEEENNQKRPLLNLIALIGNLYRLNGLLINTESNQDQYVISLSRIFANKCICLIEWRRLLSSSMVGQKDSVMATVIYLCRRARTSKTVFQDSCGEISNAYFGSSDCFLSEELRISTPLTFSNGMCLSSN